MPGMQLVNLSDNYFTLFGLPASFDVNSEALAERYREMQRTVHPDRFANAADSERRLSVQMAAHINEAFQTLKDPLARGRYLLELRGVEIDDMDTAFDDEFLMEQIELRERLGDVKESTDPHQQLQELSSDIMLRGKALTENMASFLRKGLSEGLLEDGSSEASRDALCQARDLARKLQFFRRLEEEVNVLDEELVGY